MNESAWYIELESAFCLLIGQLISYGVISSPLCASEIYNERWLKSKLFSSGIEKLEDKNIFGKSTKSVFPYNLSIFSFFLYVSARLLQDRFIYFSLLKNVHSYLNT